MDANCSFETAVIVRPDALMQRLALAWTKGILHHMAGCVELGRLDLATDSNYPVSSSHDASAQTIEASHGIKWSCSLFTKNWRDVSGCLHLIGTRASRWLDDLQQ
jgi:hypothetical protein